jgi:hypothetical protein
MVCFLQSNQTHDFVEGQPSDEGLQRASRMFTLRQLVNGGFQLVEAQRPLLQHVEDERRPGPAQQRDGLLKCPTLRIHTLAHDH